MPVRLAEADSCFNSFDSLTFDESIDDGAAAAAAEVLLLPTATHHRAIQSFGEVLPTNTRLSMCKSQIPTLSFTNIEKIQIEIQKY